jgi:hypothetical protein
MKYLKSYESFSQSLLVENFFLVTDKSKETPLTQLIMDAISRKLGKKLKTELNPVNASGAEGIVLSIDDFRVVKFFHSIENAAKSIPLFSKDYNFTAKIYSAGKIILDNPVFYYRTNSSYGEDDAKPTKVLYYLIMERVKPDEITFNDVEMAYNRIMRISNLRYEVIKELLKIDDTKLQDRLKKILTNFLVENGKIEEGDDALDFLKNLEKKDRNVLMNEGFVKWTKNKTKEFLLNDNKDRTMILKRFLTNHIGVESNREDLIVSDYKIDEIYNFIITTLPFKQKGKNGKTITESYNEIKDLIRLIIVDNKIRWNDIHNGQFARNKQNKLMALDLGVKSDIDAENYFNKNVSKISLKETGEVKLLESVSNPVKLNFYDFDGTLFHTEGKETGIPRWEYIFKTKYPHIGWISKDESLDLELDIKPVLATLSMYKQLKTPDSINVLLSDRLTIMKNAIDRNLQKYGFEMDYYLFNTGPHKVERLKQFILDFDVYEINLFDDKPSVINEFIKFRDLYNVWRPDMTINIYQSKNNELIKI